MELLDLYDDEGNALNITIERGKKPKEGNVMLSIAFIRNSENEYLIQKTSDEKGSEYSSTGGHVTHNENGITTIIRELKEELGLDVDKDEIKTIGLIKNPDKPCVINLYLLEKDIDIDKLKLQDEEVESVNWMTSEEIIKLIDEDMFLKSHGYLFLNYINN